jgi:penicillin-binding protein 1A
VKDVADEQGRLIERRPLAIASVVSPRVTFLLTRLLEGVLDHGTGRPVRLQGFTVPAAGKTGTTDDFKDAWFVGFSASVVAGVWVGFDRPAPIAPDGFGSRYALPIWAEFMTRIARLRPPEEFRAPSSVRGEQICSVTYLKANSGCPAYQEYFKAGDIPPEGVCELHRGGPSRAAAAIGGMFQRLGRGLRRLFGR